MDSPVFGKWYVPRCFPHFCNLRFLFQNYSVRLIFHRARGRVFSFAQKTSVIFWHWVFLRVFVHWLANVVQRYVCSWAYRFSEIIVLFHTFVTNLVVLIEATVESMRCLLVSSLWLVRYRSFFIVFIMVWTWCLTVSSNSHEIWFLANADSYLVNFVIIFDCLRTVLYWNLLL